MRRDNVNRPAGLLFAILFVLVIACGADAASNPAPTSPGDDQGVFPPTPTVVPAFSSAPPRIQPGISTLRDPELVGIVDWINSEPLTLKNAAADGAVLVDFWTYSCVNCIRTFPFLRAIHDRYSDQGLTIIGVHSPEFEFEKVPAHIAAAVDRYDLRYPIAVDSDKSTWDRFGNHFWPSTYLFDSSGTIVYRHFGEGGYFETEDAVRAALSSAGRDINQVAPLEESDQQRAPGAYTVTREIYLGYEQVFAQEGLFAAQSEYYEAPQSTVVYVDSDLRRHGQFELNGEWRNDSDGIVHTRSLELSGDYVVFPFFATSVNAVMGSEVTNSEVELLLDGSALTTVNAGESVDFVDGKSIVRIAGPGLYQLVELPGFGRHELTVIVRDAGVKIFDFTFGIYNEGP